MGFRRDSDSGATAADLAPAEVDTRVSAAKRRLLEYRAHNVATDPKKHPEAAAAVAAEVEAHRIDFQQRARQGPSAATRQALMGAAEQAVAALEAVFGPPPGRQPFAPQGATP
jgi:capsule polysaccharide export protein KpsE/RkpR